MVPIRSSFLLMVIIISVTFPSALFAVTIPSLFNQPRGINPFNALESYQQAAQARQAAMQAKAASSTRTHAALVQTSNRSPVWNTTEFDKFIYTSLPIVEPNISVRYGVDVQDAVGATYSDGQSISAGQCLTFTFKPHVSEDIYWYATGYYWDSPYGEWAAGGLVPDFNVLIPKNYLGHSLIYDLYVALGVEPPQKAIIAPPSGFTCTGDPSSSLNCCATKPGSYTFAFNFAPTIGKFKGGSNKNLKSITEGKWGTVTNRNLRTSEANKVNDVVTLGGYGDGTLYKTKATEPYTLNVPETNISVPVLVSGEIEGHPPITPLLSAGQCLTDQPLTITMQSTDPDDDQIRYGVDWDGDGFLDGDFVPATVNGEARYVSSGTALSASREHSGAGAKTVHVFAQDTGGQTSSWASVTFQCADNPSNIAAFCSDGLDNDGDGKVDSADPGCLSGGDNDESNPPPSSNPEAALSIRAIPSLVKSGRTTKINWSAENVQSCTVTAPNGDAWNTISSTVGGEVSRVITGEILYTLSCIDLDGDTQTKTAKVRILPSFKEL